MRRLVFGMFDTEIMNDMPTDVRDYVLRFLRPFDRLRWLAAFTAPETDALDDAFSRSEELSFPLVTVLHIYTGNNVAPQTDVDLFLWKWAIDAIDATNTYTKTLRLVIDEVDRFEQRSVERHFTDCWTSYGGRLTLRDDQNAVVHAMHAPARRRGWSTHAAGALLEGVLGRNERTLSYGFGDMTW
ncbi:hypothetical protein EBZ80_23310 [bacterium]|nr:hypothetical protein [bacterium]